MTEAVNVTMAALLAAIVSGAALVRLHPSLMKSLADWLNARADAELWFEIRHQELKQREDREGISPK